tara:strand:+ start:4359 stop:5276 length:918 start_codon:yes stop_codon:yes gene_type:complete
MRNKFADVIYKIGKKDNRICAIVADISPAGSMINFREEFPDRFINCGVAEQSMIGIAAGLALKGMRPFCYTIATFSIYRPFEMIRVDLCYQNLPVTVIGMGAGVIYSTLGGTHHTMEDIAVASAIPNMTVIAPCDPIEMELATEWCATKSSGPVYMRLGKAGEPNLTNNAIDEFVIGKIRYLKKGKKIAILSYGITVSMAFDLEKRFAEINENVSVICIHTIKPLDKKNISKILMEYEKVVILEEHVPHGGLSSKVKEIAIDCGNNAKIYSYTLQDQFIHFYGSHKELLSRHGLDVDKIFEDLKG